MVGCELYTLIENENILNQKNGQSAAKTKKIVRLSLKISKQEESKEKLKENVLLEFFIHCV